MPSTLQSLTALAAEKSSDKRRVLLREVTDLFFETSDQDRSAQESEDFDVILSSVSQEMAEEVRIELAERFADTPDAPYRLVRQLASDEQISVAGKVLQKSFALKDDDLVTIAHSRGQEHLLAIAGRDHVPEAVSDAVVQRGDDETLARLASNEGAAISRKSMETLVDRAQDATILHGPLVHRASLPPDLLNEMYAFVEDRLKQKILERNEALSESELEGALKNRRARPDDALPADYEDARKFVRNAKLRKQVDASFLARQLRDGEETRFLIAFADTAQIDFNAARSVFRNPSQEPLALVCKAAGLDRSLFVTLALLRAGEGGPDLGHAQSLGKVYDETPREAAERVMRFWKVRKAAETEAA